MVVGSLLRLGILLGGGIAVGEALGLPALSMTTELLSELFSLLLNRAAEHLWPW